tara:strand:- start:18752 stop:19135 length:384 start_codon:yes stop_codon:yes gene_type:complete
MASILRVNTLTDASSNNSIATSFVAGGSAKAWVQYDMGDSNALDDSFNISSLSDEATGRANFTVTSAFGAANHADVGMVGNNCAHILYNGDNAKTASTTGTLRHLNTSGADIDVSPYGTLTIHGDLA